MKIPITFQWPNKRLFTALAAMVVSQISSGWIHAGSRAIFFLAMSIWAYAEITEGEGWFRRGLGMVIMLYLAWSLTMALHI